MLKLCLLFAAAFVAVQGGELVIMHSPDSVLFVGKDQVDQSLLKEVLSAPLGYTVKKGEWDGVKIKNVLNPAQALLAVVLEGVDSLDMPQMFKTFPLNVDEVEEATWQAIRSRVEERSNDNTVVRISLDDGVDALGQSALGALKPNVIDETSLSALSLKVPEDKEFLEEIQLLHAIAKNAPTAIKADSNPDIYWLVMPGLRAVREVHGKNSSASREASLLLNNALSAIRNAFIEAYNGQVLVVAFTNDASKLRRTRSVTLDRQTRETAEGEGLNLAKDYNENYPVIFNILLWFGVVFVFALLAICIAIADMDPGRDSIIYRMTSNRMKKDN